MNAPVENHGSRVIDWSTTFVRSTDSPSARRRTFVYLPSRSPSRPLNSSVRPSRRRSQGPFQSSRRRQRPRLHRSSSSRSGPVVSSADRAWDSGPASEQNQGLVGLENRTSGEYEIAPVVVAQGPSRNIDSCGTIVHDLHEFVFAFRRDTVHIRVACGPTRGIIINFVDQNGRDDTIFASFETGSERQGSVSRTFRLTSGGGLTHGHCWRLRGGYSRCN